VGGVEEIHVGDLEIRPEAYVAVAGGRTLVLSLRELQLLTALGRRAGQVVSRAELYGLVWGGELRPEDRSVDVYVHKLRAKLAEALPDRVYIHTHFGLGYRLQPERSPAFHTSATTR
jgi:DNA-binding response OmpR family regulator